jgi:hypothetical protein
MGNRDKTIFLIRDQEQGGGTHAYRGAKLAKLLKQLKNNEPAGFETLVKLIENGYEETLGGVNLSDEGVADKLQAEADGLMQGDRANPACTFCSPGWPCPDHHCGVR